MEKKEKVHDWTRTTKFSKPPDILTFNTVCRDVTQNKDGGPPTFGRSVNPPFQSDCFCIPSKFFIQFDAPSMEITFKMVWLIGKNQFRKSFTLM